MLGDEQSTRSIYSQRPIHFFEKAAAKDVLDSSNPKKQSIPYKILMCRVSESITNEMTNPSFIGFTKSVKKVSTQFSKCFDLQQGKRRLRIKMNKVKEKRDDFSL